MDIEPVKRRGRPRKSVAQPENPEAGTGAHGKPDHDGQVGGNTVFPPWIEVIEIVERIASERRPHVPCRIEHPSPGQEVFHGLGYGALTQVGDSFRVLFSDGTWVSPERA